MFLQNCIGSFLYVILVVLIGSNNDVLIKKVCANDCFCQLEGPVDDCECPVEKLAQFNNLKIYPRIRSLLDKDYFRFYEVNLAKPCPFWGGTSAKCSLRSCGVQPCDVGTVPPGLNHNNNIVDVDEGEFCPSATLDGADKGLGYLDATITATVRDDLQRWIMHDEDFCDLDDANAQFYDLHLNPERYTGYEGPSATKIWRAIYVENCFRNGRTATSISYIPTASLQNLCLEERVYYRAISGLHTSINIHLVANFLLQKDGQCPMEKWGPNLVEFQRRFSPDSTHGEGPNWLRNLYFVYLLELRALVKVTKFLQNHVFYTGNAGEDMDTQLAVRDLLKTAEAFPYHFDEGQLFVGAPYDLKTQIRDRFRNVTRIMDCVECDKCRLWGKLQTRGLGTALKILIGSNGGGGTTYLRRGEIVALFNAFGRLSTSIYKLDDFKEMLTAFTKS